MASTKKSSQSETETRTPKNEWQSRKMLTVTINGSFQRGELNTPSERIYMEQWYIHRTQQHDEHTTNKFADHYA